MKATIALTNPQLSNQVLKSLISLIQGNWQLQQHIASHGIWFENLATDTIAGYKQPLHTQILNMVTPSSYRPQALDTRIETDRFEFALLRQRSNGDRLHMSMALTKGARELCLFGIKQTHTFRSKQDITGGDRPRLFGRELPAWIYLNGNGNDGKFPNLENYDPEH